MVEYHESLIRICTKCSQGLPFESFYKQKGGRWGIKSTCKKCCDKYTSVRSKKPEIIEWRKSYHKTNKSKMAQRRYHQSEKGKAALKRTAQKHPKSAEAKEKKRLWWQSEIGKAKKKIWAKKHANTPKGREGIIRRGHKRKALMKNNFTLTADEWKQIKRQFKYRCAYCGEKKPLTRDCIIPISKGGSYTKLNVIPACIHCNCSKKDKILPLISGLLPLDSLQLQNEEEV